MGDLPFEHLNNAVVSGICINRFGEAHDSFSWSFQELHQIHVFVEQNSGHTQSRILCTTLL